MIINNRLIENLFNIEFHKMDKWSAYKHNTNWTVQSNLLKLI